MEREYSQKYLQINRGKGVVYDAEETPFTYVKPECSDLGQNPGLRSKLIQNFPRLSFSGAYTIDGALIIQDINFEGITTDRARQLNDSSTRITLQVVDASSVSRNLGILINQKPEITNDAILVFPGEGAKDMYRFVSVPEANERVFIPTQRTLINPGTFNLQVDYSPLPERINSRWVLILDDVVATGQTAITVARELKRRYTNIKVAVGTWIMVEPRTESPSGISGVDEVFATYVVRGNYVKQPPINSLSCFIRNYGKYDAVKNNFIKKYISDPDTFNSIINQLGGDI